MIPDFEQIQTKVNSLLRTDDTGTFIAMDAANARPEIVDPFAKYKEHERELKRERRVKTIEKDREQRLKLKLDEWIAREANREKEKEREAERERERLKER